MITFVAGLSPAACANFHPKDEAHGSTAGGLNQHIGNILREQSVYSNDFMLVYYCSKKLSV